MMPASTAATGPFSGVPSSVSRPRSPSPRPITNPPSPITSSRPPTSIRVATRFAPSDSEMPRVFSAASRARNTTTTSTAGRLTKAPRESPATPSASAPTDTMPAESMQNPTRNPAKGPNARVA